MTRSPSKTPSATTTAGRAAPGGSLNPTAASNPPGGASGGGGLTATSTGPISVGVGTGAIDTRKETGRIWTYGVTGAGLRFSFKSDKDRDYSLDIDAPQFGATLSLLIVAAAANALIEVTYYNPISPTPQNVVLGIMLGEGVTA